MLQIAFPNETIYIIILFKKLEEARLEDVAVIAVRSAPPAGQRQGCLQHRRAAQGKKNVTIKA